MVVVAEEARAGVDVGEGSHRAHVVYASGEALLSRGVENDEAGLLALIGEALSLAGRAVRVPLFWAANMGNFARIYHGSPGRGCFALASLLFLAGTLFLIVIPIVLQPTSYEVDILAVAQDLQFLETEDRSSRSSATALPEG